MIANNYVTQNGYPYLPPPRDDREKEILEKLVAIRDRLQLLKQDRTTYIRSQDVLPLYDETIEQVRQLNECRSSDRREENRGIALSPRLCGVNG
ncbi:hypothetical protein ColKHC_07524 [Colletotrichum higginsianum]|nr:hypothetical protein ColKHC_07524 [Colletotrichum higginsianum]